MNGATRRDYSSDDSLFLEDRAVGYAQESPHGHGDGDFSAQNSPLKDSQEEFFKSLHLQKDEQAVKIPPTQVIDPATKKASKVALLFLMIAFGFFIFLSTALYTVMVDRKLPSLNVQRVEFATRGSIYSSDGFMLASSKKLYKAMINTYNINPNKKELFINLFSIYSGIPPQDIAQKLEQKGNVVLSYNIDSKTANYLKELNLKLNALNVFRAYEDSSGRVFKYGLSIVDSGEKRDYLYSDMLEPVLGYTRKKTHQNITQVEGVKGIEKQFDAALLPASDLVIQGERDIGFNVILNAESKVQLREDGKDFIVSIPLKFQKKLERLTDKFAQDFGAKEVIVGVMESKSGKILALTSSKRFNPNNITQHDYSSLNVSAIEMPFEPGSVVKPIIYGILLEKNLIKPQDTISLYNGAYKIDNFTITDTKRLQSSTIEEVLINSSNVGMALIAQNLDGVGYYEGLLSFGFGSRSGIDLPYENAGVIPDSTRLNSKIYKASVSYGYGLQLTFMQILKAYNVLVNNGVSLQPYLVESVIANNRRYYIKHEEPKRVVSPQTAKEIQQTLIKIVAKGNEKEFVGLRVGGKTGTAHIAENGKYVSRYNSSFFGFVEDSRGREYTIGVSVLEPDRQKAYFGARTAMPLFRDTIVLLKKEGYLTPNKP